VIEFVERILRGFEVDEEHLAVDLIDRIGPGGSFIAEEHTLRHFRSQLWMPRVLDRMFWDSWAAQGRPDTRRRVAERMESLRAAYQPKPLPDDLDREIRKILQRARQSL
jgi:trimethylamine--corrinoid protein Co-methyltransferase